MVSEPELGQWQMRERGGHWAAVLGQEQFCRQDTLAMSRHFWFVITWVETCLVWVSSSLVKVIGRVKWVNT